MTLEPLARLDHRDSTERKVLLDRPVPQETKACRDPVEQLVSPDNQVQPVHQGTEERLEIPGLLEALDRTASKDQLEAQEQLVTKDLPDQLEILDREARRVLQGPEGLLDSQANLVFKVHLVWLVTVDSLVLLDQLGTEVRLGNRVQLDP